MEKYLSLFHSDPYEHFTSYTKITESFRQLLLDMQHAVEIQRQVFNGREILLEIKLEESWINTSSIEEAWDIIKGPIYGHVDQSEITWLWMKHDGYFGLSVAAGQGIILDSEPVPIEMFLEQSANI